VAEFGEVAPPSAGWYKPLASHLGSAYLRYAFTMNTAQEVDFLVEALGVAAPMRVLDVGCGPGRHSLELARRGFEVVGVDISADFISLALERAASEGLSISFYQADAASMPFEEEFDAVFSVCEGAFGLALGDLVILRCMAKALRPGRLLAAAAANAFYVIKHMDEGAFDPAKMIYRESVKAVIGQDGTQQEFEMWNSCYTPRELAWLCNGAGLDAEGVYGISPGAYSKTAPGADHPELLLVARKPEPAGS
jgi:SAM-dependent methyltransferase